MIRRAAHLFLITAVCLLLTGCAGTGRLPGTAAVEWRAERMPEWEEAFQTADDRWRGADGAYSVPLSVSKTLWLFGDTWITESTAKGREQGRVIRNSVALQNIRKDEPGAIEFFWKEDEDGPKATFLLPGESGWLWPLSGERVQDSLYIFLGRFVRNDSKLGFETAGSWLFRVINPDSPPGAWETERFRVPFFEHTRNGDLIFGVGCMSHQGFLYVYGVREDWTRGVTGRSLLVARTPLESLAEADFSEWRFFSADGWVADPGRAEALFDGAATEMSVSFLPARNRFVAVYTYCGLGREIVGRLARSPEGPWGKPMTLYSCPEGAWSEQYFCYAGKAHPEFARGANELVVTYAVNSWDLEALERDLRIYWPRFVRVTGQ